MEFKVIDDSILPELTAISTANQICYDCEHLQVKKTECLNKECHEWRLIKRHTERVLKLAKGKEAKSEKNKDDLAQDKIP